MKVCQRDIHRPPWNKHNTPCKRLKKGMETSHYDFRVQLDAFNPFHRQLHGTGWNSARSWQTGWQLIVLQFVGRKCLETVLSGGESRGYANFTYGLNHHCEMPFAAPKLRGSTGELTLLTVTCQHVWHFELVERITFSPVIIIYRRRTCDTRPGKSVQRNSTVVVFRNASHKTSTRVICSFNYQRSCRLSNISPISIMKFYSREDKLSKTVHKSYEKT